MCTLIQNIRSQRGVTILEVLIALFLTGVITAAVFNTFLTQHKNYEIQDDVVEIQQNARASIDELTKQVRMAGYRVPIQLDPIEAHNTDPDTIVITYLDGDCETYLVAPMPQPSSELKCSEVSCFYDGQWVYICDPDSGGGEFFLVTHVQTSSGHLQHNTMNLSRTYDEDATVLALTQVKFYVDHSDTAHPNLMVQRVGGTPQVYAENISDLQFRYRLKNGMVVDDPILAEDIREVLIGVTGRSRIPDPDLEERRLRTYESSVNVRNIS